jgi:serine protease Do
MGNPYGLATDGQASVAIGVISNLHRQLPGLGEDDDRFYYDMIQTTASIHPGHSGGPLFNLRGEVIGVVTAMHTHAAGDDGVGFATPLTDAKRRLIDRLANGRPIEYGYVGALVGMPTAAEREAAGRPGGVVVQRIESNGPAARAALAVGDLVLTWNGQSVWAPGQFAELVGQTPSGARITVTYVRGGKPAETAIDVEARDVARAALLRESGVVMHGR